MMRSTAFFSKDTPRVLGPHLAAPNAPISSAGAVVETPWVTASQVSWLKGHLHLPCCIAPVIHSAKDKEQAAWTKLEGAHR